MESASPRPDAPRARTVLTPGAVITRPDWPADLRVRRLHVIRIGGAGMSAVARLALDAGLAVSGSDSQDGQFIAPLRAAGAEIAIGFDAAAITPDVDLVAVSTAVRPDNPEVLAARAQGIPVIHRAAALAGLLGEREVIAIAGTHGKTSTTAMTTMALRGGGADPSWALGAAVPMLGRNAALRPGPLAAVEADESDGSFLAFAPRVIVVTNLEPDHLDFHGTPQNLTAAFDALAARLQEGGTLVVCADDPGAAALGDRAAAAGVKVARYGTGAGDAAAAGAEGKAATAPAWRVNRHEARPSATLVRFGTPAGEVEATLSVLGDHNVLNALGALAAASIATGAHEQDEVQRLLDGIAPFTGASRRFERQGEEDGTVVYDDYAHHPREVEATVRAARGIAGAGRVIAVFQPHLFSRTRDFAAEFAAALALADIALVMPVYAAREDPDPATTAATITDRAPDGARLIALADRERTVPEILAHAAPGDVVLMLGAGDVVEETPGVLAALRERAAARAAGGEGVERVDGTSGAQQADGTEG